MTENISCDIILSGLLEQGVGLECITAAAINALIHADFPSSKIMRYCTDTAADQYVSEEFYQKYPQLLTFLKKCGCDNDEILFREFIETHNEIFKCKTYTCEGRIVGGCPKMYCEECGRNYFLSIDRITEKMCTNCVANMMGECTEDSRRKRHIIYVS